MVSTRRDQREGLSCPQDLGRRGHSQQGPQVDNVLWPPDIITGQDLQGDQMAGSSDAHPQLLQQVDRLGIGHDLRFDSRRGEQEVHDWSCWIARRGQSNRCEPPDSLLLDDSFDAVATGTQAVDKGFGCGIAGQRHRQIRISCEPRFGSNRDGQTADKGERDPSLTELAADLTKGGLE